MHTYIIDKLYNNPMKKVYYYNLYFIDEETETQNLNYFFKVINMTTNKNQISLKLGQCFNHSACIALNVLMILIYFSYNDKSTEKTLNTF